METFNERVERVMRERGISREDAVARVLLMGRIGDIDEDEVPVVADDEGEGEGE